MNLNVGIKNLKRGANILDIKVPAELRVKLATGISWFDDAVGGITPSTAAMITGGPGCGKTTFMLQLADALTSQGHIALMNTGEESLYQVKMVADRMGLKNGFVVGQDTLCEDLLGHADELRTENPGKQVFILQDSLQTLDDGKYKDGTTNSQTPMRCTEILTDWAKTKVNGMFGVMMFIGQVNKGGEFSGKNGIKHAVDVHCHLYIDHDKKSETYGERLFEVQKNRFGANGKTYIVGLDRNGLREKGNFDNISGVLVSS